MTSQTYKQNTMYPPQSMPEYSKKQKQPQNNPQPQQQPKRDEVVYQEVVWVDTIHGLRLVMAHKFYDSNGEIWPRRKPLKPENIKGFYLVEQDRPWLYKEGDFQYTDLDNELNKYSKELGDVYKLAEAYEQKIGKRTKPVENIVYRNKLSRFWQVALVVLGIICTGLFLVLINMPH